MSEKRDDFLTRVKETLSKRVGNLCSNPTCNTPTWGPHSDSSKSINLGVAAHITAARKGGPRFDNSLTTNERKSINNGIWLCQKCSTLIDKNKDKYTVDELSRWKKVAEERAEKALSNPRIVNYGPDFAETTLVCIMQRKNLIIDLKSPKEKRKKITIKPIKAKRNLINSTLPLLFGKQINNNEILFNLIVQNMGEGIEKDLKIDFKLNGKPLIKKIVIDNRNRIQMISGGKDTSSFATLHVPNLLPGEIQTIKIITRLGAIPEIFLSTQNSVSNEVFIYEYIFGKEEIV